MVGVIENPGNPQSGHEKGATYGMSPVERVLLTVIGVVLFGIMSWTLNRVVDNSGHIAVLQARVSILDAAMDRLYDEMRDHRRQTENKPTEKYEHRGKLHE